jgi:hypothetical protein
MTANVMPAAAVIATADVLAGESAGQRLLLGAARAFHHKPCHGAHAERAAERGQQVEQLVHLSSRSAGGAR